MKSFLVFCSALAFASSASALETTAGAQSVQSSQSGLNAKVDASNVALTAVMNKMLACNRNGQGYDSTADKCVGMTTAQQTTTQGCQKNKQFYDVSTSACVGSGGTVTKYTYDTPNNGAQVASYVVPGGAWDYCALGQVYAASTYAHGGRVYYDSTRKYWVVVSFNNQAGGNTSVNCFKVQ